jgi:glycosyltransferase involved in cell wall biosynthesis
LANLDALFSISEDGAKYLRAITDHNHNNRIKVARLGTVNTTGKLSASGTDKLVLVSCSNLIARKRVHLIIETLALLGGKVHWVHIGTGQLHEELEALAKEKLGSKENISYEFKGQMNNSDIIDYYANNAIDLFINVSDSEGVPVSIMEANSFGIPAIATNTGGVPEVINEQSGFLIDVNSSAIDIAKVITYYARLNAEGKQAYRNAAYATWNELYNAQKNYTAFVDGVMKL